MKRCDTCKQEKSESEFNKNRVKKDGLNSICRLCSNARSKRYYAENREHHLAVIRVLRKKYRDQNREWVVRYLNHHPCVKCGEKDIILLDFHHRDPSRKKFNIGSAMGTGMPLKRIKQEVKKCEILCVRCHRYKHGASWKSTGVVT